MTRTHFRPQQLAVLSSGTCRKTSGRLAYVRGLRSLLTLHNLELHSVSLLQTLVAFTGNGAVVDEHVGPIIASNEPVTFGVIEPLYSSFQRTSPWNSRSEHSRWPILTAILRLLAHSVKKCKGKRTSYLLRNRALALPLPCLPIQPEHSGNRFRVLDGSF